MRHVRSILVLASAVLAGCGQAPVKPWERELLARPEMALEPDPLLAAQRRHAEFSKEGSTGDAVMAGSGCGCN